MKKNERLDALQILTTCIEQKRPLSHLMKGATPLTKEICFGVTRQFIRLEAIANCLINKRPKDHVVWLSILIGLYQLHYLNIPDYAVVKETVSVLDQLKKSSAKAFVNAILRRFCREKETILASLQSNKAFLYGHPAWFIKRIQQAWPNDWQTILTENDRHPPMSLRVNAAHTNVAAYLERLYTIEMHGFENHVAPDCIVLTKACDVHDLPGFAVGDVSVQDPAAQLAAHLLDLKPNLRVLDACCAPGGKTCHMLEIEPTLNCTAIDIEAKRLQRVRENLDRLKLHAELKQGDALDPTTWWDGVLFDRILLDAPCSATGVIRRHPDIKLLRTPEEIDIIVKLQQQILSALWPLLAPGGRLVYATCSIMPAENEEQIAGFIASHPEARCINPEKSWGHATPHGRQILPGEQQMDGFFYSILERNF